MAANGNGLWKQVALILASILVSGTVAFLAGRFAGPQPLTVEQVRQAVAESFTELSNTRSIYAIEGRPRLAALETNLGRLQSRQEEMLSILHKTQASLAIIQKATADGP